MDVHTTHQRMLPVDGRPTEATLTVRADDTAPGLCSSLSVVASSTASRRPIVFVFNGGPGVSSMWLQLSGLAPWRAGVPQDLEQLIDSQPALQLTETSLFDVADLVFLDPPGTGFGSHPAPPEVLGAESDAALVAETIVTWLREHGREASDVFLLGESYGTIRAALVASRLDDQWPGVRLRGIALLGQCLNAQEVTQRPGNAAGFVAALPFIAATAWFHGLGDHTDRSLVETTNAARAFAAGPYSQALAAGAWTEEVDEALRGFSGLSLPTLRRLRRRIDKEWFRRSLLSDLESHVGLTDSRYSLRVDPGQDIDAADARLTPVFAAALAELHSSVFGVPQGHTYTESFEAHESWDYQESSAEVSFGGSPLPSPFASFDYPRHLQHFLDCAAERRVFIGTGHFDALTTVGGVDHLLTQYGLPTERFDRHEYPAGHMMYSDAASSLTLVSDLKRFLTTCTTPVPHPDLGASPCLTR